MPPLLRLRNVEARYGKLVALHNVSLIVPGRSVVALLGANGAGKSTLLRTVSGMMAPSRGEIWFDGERIDGLPDHAIARRGIAHIPEGRGIFPGLSVRENLTIAGGSAEDAVRAYEMFPILKARLDQTAGTLSGGEQQMLSLARALITTPRLLLVDELSLGLAPIVVSQLFDKLRIIAGEGTTVLLVEQYVRYALALADIVAVMHKGSIPFIGEPGELAHEDRLMEAYLGQTQAQSIETSPNGGAKTAAGRSRTPSGPRGSTRRSSRASRK
ncbi:MAG: ABC transporter ATP-binding protein [Actinomycetota bacterium]